ncbi:MAG: tRNA uridine-5-carboxymethylaminomethyl(34) synthesis GTPase MnmE [Gemmataceae bacterium]|nr:tRNA uridine-5-carboxymethylaminomethyl(34) synthesis GTPase MnmE [Gemmata sp.]MDW8197618.1 tRNA uridine-5-carboxymethylaminomethyl(34) synthesis GTPase MnmE [Gemmataceae bacterium]
MAFEKVTAPHLEDTIVAVSSAPGPARRAIVRVSGPHSQRVVEAVFTANEEPLGWLRAARRRRLIRGRLRLSGVHALVPAMLYVFAQPHSYTGQDVAEIHTLGSPPLVERLVADLLTAGARPARAGEFTLRAFLAGKKNLPQAEAVQAVIEAETEADLQAALTQLAGGLSRPLETLRDDLLNLLADIEAALDFVDEDITFVGKSDILQRLQTGLELLQGVQQQLDTRTVSGRPVRVALVGLPNAGKSSLFNALAGATALVSPLPGTTRDYLTKSLTIAGVPVELIDTAGWQDANDTIEEQAQQLGREQAHHADILLWCDEHGQFPSTAAARLQRLGGHVLKVRTKMDLANEEPISAAARSSTSAATAHPLGPLPVIPCSTQLPDGLEAVRAALHEAIITLTRPPLAPSQSRCRHHVQACLARLQEAADLAASDQPPELLAFALRQAIEQLGEMTGAIYTNDLLDRIFSRFCIGK